MLVIISVSFTAANVWFPVPASTSSHIDGKEKVNNT